MNGFDFGLNPFDGDDAHEDAHEVAAAGDTGPLGASLEPPAPSPFESPESLSSTVSPPTPDAGALAGLRAALGLVGEVVSQPHVPDHDSELSLQEQLADNKETATLLSNISKMRHDTSMGIIGNMK